MTAPTPDEVAGLIDTLRGRMLPSGGEYLTMCERAAASLESIAAERDRLRALTVEMQAYVDQQAVQHRAEVHKVTELLSERHQHRATIEHQQTLINQLVDDGKADKRTIERLEKAISKAADYLQGEFYNEALGVLDDAALAVGIAEQSKTPGGTSLTTENVKHALKVFQDTENRNFDESLKGGTSNE